MSNENDHQNDSVSINDDRQFQKENKKSSRVIHATPLPFNLSIHTTRPIFQIFIFLIN